jgi:hypothetical protein
MSPTRCLAAFLAAALLGGCDLREAFDTVVLLRWGHGAHDWMLPDKPGDLDGRHP